jgi:integrase
VLSDLELTAIWHAAGTLGYPFCQLVRLLMLLGQRREEVGGLQWLEIKDNEMLWVIPAERAKNDQTHDVPLPSAALTIFRSLPRFVLSDNNNPYEAELSPYLFTTTGTTSVSGYSKAKHLLDAAVSQWLTEHSKREGKPVPKIEPWRLHDLRRTFSTGLARKGWPQHVVEKLLNHKSGVTSGIAGVYNRYQYLEERRAAVDAWAEHVLALAYPPQTTEESSLVRNEAA